MKVIVALCAIGLTCSASFAQANATRLRNGNGGIVIAQSYCGQCSDARTSCVARCNGSGACIQRCDDEYDSCLDRNFCRARR
jgi:hypothetical protein